jgi:hypothetical protein
MTSADWLSLSTLLLKEKNLAEELAVVILYTTIGQK